MRLYVNAVSKQHIGYTPDMLYINSKEGVRKEYDIQGDDDFDNDGLNCRVKGDLFIANEDDYYEMDDNQIEELVKSLQDKENKIIITIYPVDDSDKNLELVSEDELTNCSATLCISNSKQEFEVSFEFKTECYA